MSVELISVLIAVLAIGATSQVKVTEDGWRL